mmetsp:Transcript_24847/g.69262  ORF Transcript_24847/g.69262 Transcript_24847/m.69262 type:complete len:82 (-) Transcript_24847:91-336(-)
MDGIPILAEQHGVLPSPSLLHPSLPGVPPVGSYLAAGKLPMMLVIPSCLHLHFPFLPASLPPAVSGHTHHPNALCTPLFIS